MNLCLAFTLHNLQVYGPCNVQLWSHAKLPCFWALLRLLSLIRCLLLVLFLRILLPLLFLLLAPLFLAPFLFLLPLPLEGKKLHINRPTVASAGTRPRRPARSCSDHWSAWSPENLHCHPSCARPASVLVSWLFLDLSMIYLPLGMEQRWGGGLALPSSWKECGHPQCQRVSLQHPEEACCSNNKDYDTLRIVFPDTLLDD